MRFSVLTAVSALGVVLCSCSQPETKTVAILKPAPDMGGEHNAAIVDARLEDYGLAVHSVDFSGDSLYLTVPVDTDEKELMMLTRFKGELSFAPVVMPTEYRYHSISSAIDSIKPGIILPNSTPQLAFTVDDLDKARIDSLFTTPKIGEVLPKGVVPAWSMKTKQYFLKNQADSIASVLYLINTDEAITVNVENSDYGNNDNFDYIYCDIKMDRAGARQFENLTTNNIGKPIAVIVDGYVMSAPVVNCPIEGGRAQITGCYDMKIFKALSIALKHPLKD